MQKKITLEITVNIHEEMTSEQAVGYCHAIAHTLESQATIFAHGTADACEIESSKFEVTDVE